MALNSTLNRGKNEGAETVTFYHVSTEVSDFKSFFREGAKAVGKGIGGQTDGFFVWTNEQKAIRHFSHFLNDFTNEAMIIGITVPKADISYPIWQQDMEVAYGIYDLWKKYGDFINQKGHNLNITFDKKHQTFGWNFKKITDFSYEKEYSNFAKKYYEDICFKGIDETGKSIKKAIWEEPGGAEDSVNFQILTDWLCQNNSDFRKDYDALMQKIITHSQHGFALKYTGTASLPITSAQHVKINEDGSIQKTIVFEAQKGSNQVCPFLTIGLARKKEK